MEMYEIIENLKQGYLDQQEIDTLQEKFDDSQAKIVSNLQV